MAREDRFGERRRPGQHPRALGSRQPGQRLLEQLAHHAVPELLLELAPARSRVLHSLLAGVGESHGYEAGLPDAGRALDQRHCTRPVSHAVGQLPQRRKLARPLEEVVPGAHDRERSSSCRIHKLILSAQEDLSPKPWGLFQGAPRLRAGSERVILPGLMWAAGEQ